MPVEAALDVVTLLLLVLHQLAELSQLLEVLTFILLVAVSDALALQVIVQLLELAQLLRQQRLHVRLKLLAQVAQRVHLAEILNELEVMLS